MSENKNTAKPKPKDEEVPAVGLVSVSKEFLDKVSAQMEELLAQAAAQQLKIEMLTNVADKARMSRYEDKIASGKIIRKARIALWEDKLIVAWAKVKDEVGYRDNRLHVHQIIKLFLHEGKDKAPTSVELDYLYWSQNTKTREGEVVSKTNDDTGEYWTVQFEDGEKISVDIRFINAF